MRSVKRPSSRRRDRAARRDLLRSRLHNARRGWSRRSQRCLWDAKTLGAPKQKRKQVSTMKKHTKIPAALGLTVLTGLLLAALALTIKPIAEHRHETGATLGETNDGRVGISD